MGSTSLWIVTSTFRICKRKSTKPRPLRRKTYGPSSVFLRPKNYPGRRHLAVISPRQPIVRLSATIRYPQPQSNCDYRFLSNYILMLHYQLAFFTVSERRQVLEVEQGTFTPLVFTSTGGMADEYKRFHSRLAELLALKKGDDYATTISWIRAKVSFAILRSALLCLRGTRSKRGAANISDIDITSESAQARI